MTLKTVTKAFHERENNVYRHGTGQSPLYAKYSLLEGNEFKNCKSIFRLNSRPVNNFFPIAGHIF